jgi:hypothetical protein
MSVSFDAFSSFDVTALRLTLNVYDLSLKYNELDYDQRTAYIEYIQDEFAPMDDEYSDIVDACVLSLYQHQKREDLEHCVMNLTKRFDVDKMDHVVQAMLEYADDFLSSRTWE